MFMTSGFLYVKYVMPTVLVSTPLRTGPLLPGGRQGTFNGDILIRMRMLRSMGQDSNLDASLQWVGGLWVVVVETADLKA